MLIRNAEALEVLEKVTTLVVDKTGTLTEGKPRLVTVEPPPASTSRTLLRLAASLENVSEHPLAAAIVAGARERDVDTVAEVTDFDSVTGKGVSGHGRRAHASPSAICGTSRRCGIDPGPLRSPGRGTAP